MRSRGGSRSVGRRVAAGAAILLVGLLPAACGQIPTTDPTQASPSAREPDDTAAPPASGSDPPGTGTCEYTATGEAARPVQLPSPNGVPESGTATARIALSGGTVTITLDQLKAPCTVHSFVSLARQKFYDGTSCHRLADRGIYILQCGDPTATGQGGPGYSYADETDGTESYTEGVVAMANSGPNTNGSQFFIVWADSTGLDSTPNYTIFGKLDAASLAVVKRIGEQGQDGSLGDSGGKPLAPADISTVTVS